MRGVPCVSVRMSITCFGFPCLPHFPFRAHRFHRHIVAHDVSSAIHFIFHTCNCCMMRSCIVGNWLGAVEGRQGAAQQCSIGRASWSLDRPARIHRSSLVQINQDFFHARLETGFRGRNVVEVVPGGWYNLVALHFLVLYPHMVGFLCLRTIAHAKSSQSRAFWQAGIYRTRSLMLPSCSTISPSQTDPTPAHQFIFIRASISVWKSGTSRSSLPAQLAPVFAKTHQQSTYQQIHPPTQSHSPSPRGYLYAHYCSAPAPQASTRPPRRS